MNGWTLLLQVVNFVVLAWLLHRLLYKPVLALANERRARIEQGHAEARDKLTQAEELRAAHAARLVDIEAERDRMLAEGRAALSGEHAQMQQQSAAQIEADRAEASRRLERERTAAVDRIQAQAATLAERIARRLLAETGGADADARLLARVCERLDALSQHELHGLLNEGAGTQPVIVISARTMSGPEREQLRQRLQSRLGSAVTLEFVQDPALLAGVELRFAHGALSACWRDALAAACDELAGDPNPR